LEPLGSTTAPLKKLVNQLEKRFDQRLAAIDHRLERIERQLEALQAGAAGSIITSSIPLAFPSPSSGFIHQTTR
jgi:hypothetical protein